MKNLLLMLFLLSYSQLFSQEKFDTYKGYIQDNKTNQPIPFINLSIESQSINIFSNENGYFECKMPQGITKNVKIKLQHILYESKEINLAELKKENLLISLNPSPFIVNKDIKAKQNVEELVKKIIKKLSLTHSLSAGLHQVFYRNSEVVFGDPQFESTNGLFTEAIIDVYHEPFFEIGKSNFMDWYKNIKERFNKIRFYDLTSPLFPRPVMPLMSIPFEAVPYIKATGFLGDLNWKSYAYLQKNELKNYDYLLLDSILKKQSQEIYIINFKSKTKKEYGSLWVDAKSFALLRLEHGDNRITTDSETNSTNTSEGNTIIDYVEKNDKYYPSKMLRTTKSSHEDSQSSTIKKTVLFFLNSIFEATCPSNFLTKNVTQYYSEAPFESDNFFGDYNVLPSPTLSQILGLDTTKTTTNKSIDILNKSWQKSNTISKASYKLKHQNRDKIIDYQTYFDKHIFGIYGAKFHTRQKENEMMFDGNKLTIVDHIQKNIQDSIYLCKENNIDVSLASVNVNGGLFPPLMRTDVFYSNLIQRIRDDKSIEPGTEIVGKDTCHVIRCDYAHKEYSKKNEVSRAILATYIRKKDFLPIQLTLEIQFVEDEVDITTLLTGQKRIVWTLQHLEVNETKNDYQVPAKYEDYKPLELNKKKSLIGN